MRPYLFNYISVGLLAIAAFSIGAAQERPKQITVEESQNQEVWHWSNPSTSDLTLIFEIFVDGKTIKKFEIPIRKDIRKDVKPVDLGIEEEFSFTLDHSFKRPSYGKVTGNIWENGYETEGPLIGIMVWNPKIKGYENRIINDRLLVPVNRPESFSLGHGVVIRTRCEAKTK